MTKRPAMTQGQSKHSSKPYNSSHSLLPLEPIRPSPYSLSDSARLSSLSLELYATKPAHCWDASVGSGLAEPKGRVLRYEGGFGVFKSLRRASSSVPAE